MIDTLLAHRAERAVGRRAREPLGLDERGYAVLTLHRPANVDDPARLRAAARAAAPVAAHMPVVFPVHPRTARRLAGERACTPAPSGAAADRPARLPRASWR